MKWAILKVKAFKCTYDLAIGSESDGAPWRMRECTKAECDEKFIRLLCENPFMSPDFTLTSVSLDFLFLSVASNIEILKNLCASGVEEWILRN